MSIYKMNSDQSMKFTQLYKDCQCLWDVNSLLYADRNARDQALSYISEEMNISGFGPREVAQKIKNIRSTYKQLLMRIEASKRVSVTPHDVYKPKTQWFYLVDSFLGSMKREPPSDDQENVVTSDNVVIKTEASNSNDSNNNDASEDGICAGQTDAASQLNTNRESSSLPIKRNLPTKRKNLSVKRNLDIKKSRYNNTVDGICTGQITGTSRLNTNRESSSRIRGTSGTLNVSQETTSKPSDYTETEFDIWAKSLAVQLNKMDTSRALQLQLKIQTLVCNERLIIEKNESRQYASGSPLFEFRQSIANSLGANIEDIQLRPVSQSQNTLTRPKDNSMVTCNKCGMHWQVQNSGMNHCNEGSFSPNLPDDGNDVFISPSYVLDDEDTL